LTPTVRLPRLHPNQRRLDAESARFNVVNCGRRCGKTVFGLDRAVHPALAGAPVGWFAPEFRLLREAWRDLRSILAGVITQVSEQEKRLELITGGTIECWAFDRNPNAGRSRRYQRVVVDEAAHCNNLESVWNKAVRPTLTDFKGDAWFLSSPNGENFFHTLWKRGQDEAETAWRSWTFTSYDNPFLDPLEIDAARAELPQWVFEQEYLAKFQAEGGDTLLAPGWLDLCAAVTRAHGFAGEPAIAVDIAKGTGRDRTVIVVGDDLGMLDLIVSNTVSLPEAAAMVARTAPRYGVRHERIVYDAGGWAGPDFGRYLEALNILDATPYFGGASGGGRYANRRSRSAWALRQRLDPTRARLPDAPPMQGLDRDRYLLPHLESQRPADPATGVPPPWAIPPAVVGVHWGEMREELLALRYTHGDRKLALEPKEDLVGRLGRSPDLADAMIMLGSLWVGLA
jgi:hypothetical protein